MKVFIISLDGATFDVLKPLAVKGYMPNLRNLMDGGSYTILESILPPLTPAAWASFMTGKRPETHGVFDFKQYDPNTYSDRFVSSKVIKDKTLWQLLTEKGKKIIVINLPMTYPPSEVNGYMVSGFDTPSVRSKFTYPIHLREEILRLIPDYDFLLGENDGFLFEDDFKKLISKIKRGMEQRFLLSQYLLDKEYWDVFMVHFQETDHIQHKFWYYLDAYDKVMGKERRSLVFSCYTYLDELIGRLLAQIREEPSYKIILSDHGFGGVYKVVYPNNLLLEWNLLSLKRGRVKKFIKKSNSRFVSFLGYMYNALREFFQNREARQLNRLRKQSVLSDLPFDWENTKAYVPLANNVYGFCYINKIGREPSGIVSKEDYESLCREIRDKFTEVVDPHNGKKIFKEVVLAKDFFKDDKNYILPDLILFPQSGYSVRKSLNKSSPFSDPGHQGNHKAEGVLIINGENIKKKFTHFKANIIDIAPTILYMLGLSIPEDMEGHPLLDIFEIKKEIDKENIKKDGYETRENNEVYAEEEKDLIESRLRGLGYLG